MPTVTHQPGRKREQPRPPQRPGSFARTERGASLSERSGELAFSPRDLEWSCRDSIFTHALLGSVLTVGVHHCAPSEAEVPRRNRCVTKAQREEGGIRFHSPLQALIFTSFLEALFLSFHPEKAVHFTGQGGRAGDGFTERSNENTPCLQARICGEETGDRLFVLPEVYNEKFLSHLRAPGAHTGHNLAVVISDGGLFKSHS